MLQVNSAAFPIIGMDELEMSPWVALDVLKREPGVVTPALVYILILAVGSSHPHELRHRLGQHTQALLAFFELLFCSLLLLDIGAGANPLHDLALGVFERLCSDQEPAIVPGRTLAQALFHFIPRT